MASSQASCMSISGGWRVVQKAWTGGAVEDAPALLAAAQAFLSQIRRFLRRVRPTLQGFFCEFCYCWRFRLPAAFEIPHDVGHLAARLGGVGAGAADGHEVGIRLDGGTEGLDRGVMGAAFVGFPGGNDLGQQGGEDFGDMGHRTVLNATSKGAWWASKGKMSST
jgi:hypothetical protein